MSSYFQTETLTRGFIDTLKSKLLSQLPGVEAHLRLAPEVRINDLKIGSTPDNALESAVLILLYPFGKRLHSVVILRNEYDGAHSGQISLPGGKAEPTDADFKQTAVREAHEEVGIDPEGIEIVGQLSRFYVRPSNFVIYPYVAFMPHRPDFRADTTEVQRIIEVDIFSEINYSKVGYRELKFKNNLKITAPGFVVGGEFMWGATAMIFSELLQILNQVIESMQANSPS